MCHCHTQGRYRARADSIEKNPGFSRQSRKRRGNTHAPKAIRQRTTSVRTYIRVSTQEASRHLHVFIYISTPRRSLVITLTLPDTPKSDSRAVPTLSSALTSHPMASIILTILSLIGITVGQAAATPKKPGKCRAVLACSLLLGLQIGAGECPNFLSLWALQP